MKKRLLLVLCLNILLGSSWVAAQSSQPAVKIGIPLPLTGQFKEFGVMMKNSFEMAAESINQSGGINGRPIELVFANDQGETSAVSEAFKYLVSAGVVMLLGGYASDPTFYMARMANEEDLPFLICTASADRITQQGWKNVYRMNPPVSEYTKGLEDFWIKNLKPKSMAIIFENSMFGTYGAMRLDEFCRSEGIEIRASFNYDRKRADELYFRSLVASLKDDPPEVISMISYLEDGVSLVKELRNLKVNSLLCGVAGGFTLPEFVKLAGDSANYLVTGSLWSKDMPYVGAKEYYTNYSERFGKFPDYHGVEAYSALLVAAQALKQAKSYEPADIRTVLNSLYMKTPFGPVKFYSYEGFERQNTISTLVLQVIAGQFETIWPPAVATAQFQGTGFSK